MCVVAEGMHRDAPTASAAPLLSLTDLCFGLFEKLVHAPPRQQTCQAYRYQIDHNRLSLHIHQSSSSAGERRIDRRRRSPSDVTFPQRVHL
jgi:hypothetical protein